MFCSLSSFRLYRSEKRRAMGIDLGDKTLGLSLSDLTWTVATPYKTSKWEGFSQALQILIKIIKDFDVIALVIGNPLNMNGTRGPRSKKVQNFSEKFLDAYDIPLLLWDERLSTVAVTRTLLEADVSRKRQRASVDKMAASFILQGVLDACAFSPSDGQETRGN